VVSVVLEVFGSAGAPGGSGRNSCTRSHRLCPSFIIYTPTHGKTVRTWPNDGLDGWTVGRLGVWDRKSSPEIPLTLYVGACGTSARHLHWLNHFAVGSANGLKIPHQLSAQLLRTPPFLCTFQFLFSFAFYGGPHTHTPLWCVMKPSTIFCFCFKFFHRVFMQFCYCFKSLLQTVWKWSESFYTQKSNHWVCGMIFNFDSLFTHSRMHLNWTLINPTILKTFWTCGVISI